MKIFDMLFGKQTKRLDENMKFEKQTKKVDENANFMNFMNSAREINLILNNFEEILREIRYYRERRQLKEAENRYMYLLDKFENSNEMFGKSKIPKIELICPYFMLCLDMTTLYIYANDFSKVKEYSEKITFLVSMCGLKTLERSYQLVGLDISALKNDYALALKGIGLYYLSQNDRKKGMEYFEQALKNCTDDYTLRQIQELIQKNGDNALNTQACMNYGDNALNAQACMNLGVTLFIYASIDL